MPAPVLDEQTIVNSIKDPRAALMALEKYESEHRLIDFMSMMWHILEPGREMIINWPLEAICECLEAVTYGDLEGRGLLMNVPPGFTKSLSTNVFWPAWEWGPMDLPWIRYISASYSEKLTIRDNRKCRTLITSEEYQSAWGDRFQLLGDQNEKVKFENNHRGWKMATSCGGYVMGERADRVIIDDPNNTKSSESEPIQDSILQWFTEVVPTRVNDPLKSTIIVIMQRTHERDVSGHILANELDSEHLMIPMEFEEDRKCTIVCKGLLWEDPRTEEGELAAPERFSADYLNKNLKPTLRSWGGEYAIAGQLQQRPQPRGGGMFQRDDFTVIPEMPPSAKIVKVVRGWDLAGTKGKRSPWTVGLKMSRAADGRIFVQNVVRKQGTPGEVEDMLADTAEVDTINTWVSIPQDPGQAGLAQKRALASKLHGYRVHFSPESGEKEMRARPLASQSEAGNLYLIEGAWNATFIRELCDFPRGQFKDQVDAGSRAYALLMPRKQDSEGLAGPMTIKSQLSI